MNGLTFQVEASNDMELCIPVVCCQADGIVRWEFGWGDTSVEI